MPQPGQSDQFQPRDRGSDAETRGDQTTSNINYLDLVGDKQSFKVAQATVPESDRWANYRPETSDALRTLETGRFGDFAKLYQNGDATVKGEIEGALRSAGITIKQDNDALRLTMTDSRFRSVERGLAITSNGSLLPEVKTSNELDLQMFRNAQPKNADGKVNMDSWGQNFIRAIKNRPEVRGA